MGGLVPGSRAPGPPVEWQIVGVVGNVTTVERFGDPKAPQIYVPFAQNPWPQATAAVRVATDPQALRPSLAAAVHSVDPDLPLTEVLTMEQIVGERMAPDRLNIALYGGLAALALLLAALGIHSVMAFTVAQRTSEIGLRMALGAQQSRVRLQLLEEGLTLAAGGLAVCGAFESVYWTEDVAQAEEQLRTSLPGTAQAARRELWLAGTISERARAELKERGGELPGRGGDDQRGRGS